MKPIEELTFADDFMFGYIMKNPEICKEVLERLLKIKIEKVEYPELQKSISDFYDSKGIRLDVYVKDSDKIFDIEIQNSFQKEIGKRSRYYQSMIDIDNLLKGDDYTDLRESFIIFICTFDPFQKNLPCYTFKNVCLENNNVDFNDKTTKILFNTTAYDKEKDVDISAFLRYINNKESTDSFTNKLDSLVELSKQNQSLRSNYLAMNLHDRDIRRAALEEGFSQGAEQAKIETAKNLLAMKLPLDSIAKATGLPLETIQNLAKEQNAENIQR